MRSGTQRRRRKPIEAGDGRWPSASQSPSIEESDRITRSIAPHGLPRIGRREPARSDDRRSGDADGGGERRSWADDQDTVGRRRRTRRHQDNPIIRTESATPSDPRRPARPDSTSLVHRRQFGRNTKNTNQGTRTKINARGVVPFSSRRSPPRRTLPVHHWRTSRRIPRPSCGHHHHRPTTSTSQGQHRNRRRSKTVGPRVENKKLERGTRGGRG